MVYYIFLSLVKTAKICIGIFTTVIISDSLVFMIEYEESMEPVVQEYFVPISFACTTVQQAARVVPGNGPATVARQCQSDRLLSELSERNKYNKRSLRQGLLFM